VSEHHRRQSREELTAGRGDGLLVVTLETIRVALSGWAATSSLPPKASSARSCSQPPCVGDTLEDEQRDDIRLEIRRIDRTA
jgi:hypothetical protein